MGFKFDDSYTLDFSDTKIDGLVIKVKALPLGDYLKLVGTLAFTDWAEMLAQYLIDWNLDDSKGKPVAKTLKGITDNVGPAVLATIVQRWIETAKGESAPLEVA